MVRKNKGPRPWNQSQHRTWSYFFLVGPSDTFVCNQVLWVDVVTVEKDKLAKADGVLVFHDEGVVMDLRCYALNGR